MATAVSVSLALAGVVATEAPAQALMTAPSGGSGYTTSTISEPQLAYVSMGSSTQRFAFSNSRSGFIEVGGSAVNDPYITLRSYVDGALDPTFGGTGVVSFLGQLYNYDNTFDYRVELQFATYANGTKWMVLERNSRMASGLNFLHLGTYTGGYVSTLTMPTGNSEYSTCQGLLSASVYTTLSYTAELIQDSPFATPTYLFRCGIYLTSLGGGTSYVDYLTTLSGGTVLGSAGTHNVGLQISPIPTQAVPSFIRMGYSRNPAATGTTPILTAFYQGSNAATQITSLPNPYSTVSTWNMRKIYAVTAAGAISNYEPAWTGAQTGTRTGTIYIAPRNSGTIYATTLASDGTNFNGAVLAFSANGSSVTSSPITGAITGATGWNTQYIVSDSTISSSTVKLTSYDNSTVRSFEISTSTGVATAAGSFNTGGTDWESFRWFPAATSTGVDFYGRTSASTITRVSTSSAPVAPTTPSAPTVTRGNASAAVSWVAPANGGAPISAYELQYSSDAGSNWTSWSTTLTSSPETVTGLTNGIAYTFKISATNSVGTSAFSTASTAVTPATVPGAPALGSVTSGNTQIVANWSAPTGTGGSAITDYTVEYSADAGSTWSAFAHAASTATTATISGLNNGTAYLVRVSAVNAVGTGPASANSSSQLVAAAPGQPNAPTIINGSTQVTINWTAPAANGCAITGYHIELSSNGGSSWSTVAPNATGTSYTATGLTNGTAYVFRLAATNCMGFGATSAASASVTPNPVSSQPIGLTVTGSGSNQVTLNWSAPSNTGGTPISDYVIEYSTDGGITWQTYADGVSSATTANVTGLTAGLNYSFRVSAVNGVGPSSSSTSTLSLASGSVPSAVVASPTSAVAPGTTTLNWTLPADGGSPLTSAELQYSTNGGSTWIAYTGPVDLSGTIAVSGLTGGQSYVFRVRALNFFGSSAWSPATAAITFQAATAPSAVTGVNSTAGNTAGSVNLSWTAPAANGSSITDYTIEYSVDGGATWQTYSHSPSASTSVTLTGLVPGANYLFRVSAVNGVGAATASPASTPVVATVISASTDISKLPTNIKVGRGGAVVTNGSISFSGDNMGEITTVLMNGWESLISSRTVDSMTVKIPLQVSGWVDVEFVTKFGKIRYDKLIFVALTDSNTSAKNLAIAVGFKVTAAAAGVSSFTKSLNLRSIDRITTLRAGSQTIKSVTCIAYVPKGTSSRAALLRAKAVCSLVAVGQPGVQVRLAVTTKRVRAHVVVLAQK